MSKSKGNVITPMHLLDQYGSDAVRYWSLSAKLGTDTAFDEKVLKVGRRLVTKLFNASKFVLAQERPRRPDRARPGPGLPSAPAADRRAGIGVPGDLRVCGGPRRDRALLLDAASRIPTSRWSRRGHEARADTEGRASAIAALHLALTHPPAPLCPFLPYITEEAWSWRYAAGGEAFIHLSSWPSPSDFEGLPPGNAAVFAAASAFLECVHRMKSASGASVGRHVAHLRVVSNAATRALIEPCISDVQAAARVVDLQLSEDAALPDGEFRVLESQLGEAPSAV